jgi:hypothetical protein
VAFHLSIKIDVESHKKAKKRWYSRVVREDNLGKSWRSPPLLAVHHPALPLQKGVAQTDSLYTRNLFYIDPFKMIAFQ